MRFVYTLQSAVHADALQLLAYALTCHLLSVAHMRPACCRYIMAQTVMYTCIVSHYLLRAHFSARISVLCAYP